ncbi:MAG: DNA polymerase III subunit delta [Deltaproteobacteria bacterium]|nr:DNA polymerase III subunit delta [Deltaproteobacteria bacterium]
MHSIYLILNEDPYLADQALAKLRSELKKEKNEFEDLSFDASEMGVEALLNELNSFSFFSSYKLIRIQNAEKFKKNDWEKIIPIQKDNEGACLYISCANKTLYKELNKQAQGSLMAIECLKPKPRDLPQFLIQAARKEGKEISLDNARLIFDLIGDDLAFALGQLELLALFTQDKKRIEAEDIHALLSETSEKNVFAFTRSLSQENLVQGNLGLCFGLLEKILKQGEAPVKLMGLLARHFRIVLKTKLLQRHGASQSDICQQLKIPPFGFSEYATQAAELSWKKLIRLYSKLAEGDMHLKSVPLPAEKIFQKFLLGVFES